MSGPLAAVGSPEAQRAPNRTRQAGARDHVTVACGAGFAGDRVEPAVSLAASGTVDWVALECLAERTLVHGLVARAGDAAAGYDPRLERRLTPLLPVAEASGCGVVTNLGAANPVAAGEAITRLRHRLGLPAGAVAVVTGDDVRNLLPHVTWDGANVPHEGQWLGVHAYLGMDAIAQAVADGAGVVVTGRVADSALFAGPVSGLMDLGDAGRAGAITVGHLLECGGQLTGGNLADDRGPALDAAALGDLGYPLATVSRDGTATIGVLPGAPARLDTLTCVLQLLYEVHDPRRYLTPDAALDFGEVRFEETGRNEVTMSGCRANGPPPTLKVVGFARFPGQIADVEIAFAGSGALRRAQVAAETLRIRVDRLGTDATAVDIVGVDSVLGSASRPSGEPAEARVHVSARCASAELAQAVEDEVFGLTLTGPAGGCGLRSARRPLVDVVAGRVDRQRVRARVEWVDG